MPRPVDSIALPERLDLMDDWFKMGVGAKVLIEEKDIFAKQLMARRPRRLLQLGGLLYVDFPLKNTHMIQVDPREGHLSFAHNVCAEYHRLPFRDGSFNMMLCPHVHELIKHPVQLFQEAYRVLAPQGCLLVLGFNTLSLWGLQRLMGQTDIAQWNPSFRSTRLIVRVLQRQGFVLDQLTTHCYAPYSRWLSESSRAKVFDYMGENLWPYSGAIYALLFTKQQMRHAEVGPAAQMCEISGSV